MRNLNIKLCYLIYIALLQVNLFSSFANAQEHIIIQHPESSVEPYIYNIEIEENQRLDFQFDLSQVDIVRVADNLLITFLHISPCVPNTVTLENLFSVSPTPIIHLVDNYTTTPEGVLEAISRIKEQQVQNSIEEIQALIESDDVDIELPETAAGNPVVSSVPLFSFLGGNLKDRFLSVFSSNSSSDTNHLSEQSSSINDTDDKINELRKTTLSLAIVHSQKELDIHSIYKIRIYDVYEQVKERVDSGLGNITDLAQVTLWVTQSKQKQAQIQMALDIALDDYEDLMGIRPAPFDLYPNKWQEAALPSLSNQLENIAEHKQKTVRELWRLVSLEKHNLLLQKQQIDMSEEILTQVVQRFNIGQTSLGEVLSAHKYVFEYAIIENQMNYRAYIALAKLYDLTGKLSTQLPTQWRTQQ